MQQKNNGIAKTRDIGLALAMGKYIVFVDYGDIVQNQMYEKIISQIVKHNADFGICAFVKKVLPSTCICDTNINTSQS